MKKSIICCLTLSMLIGSCRQDEPTTPNKEAQDKKEQTQPNEEKQGANEEKGKDTSPSDENKKDDKNNQNDSSKPEKSQEDKADESEKKPQTPDEKPQEPKKKHSISDHDLGKQAQVEWLGNEADRLSHLDFEALYLSKETKAFSLAQLKPYIRIYSSDPERKQFHTLDEEELKFVEIKDLRYEDAISGNGYLTFHTSYKGFTSNTRHSLPFSRLKYYTQRVQVLQKPIAGWYMRGVAQNLRLFYGETLNYDTTRYAADLDESSVQYSDSDNSISFLVNLEHRATGRVLANIPILLSGFKPLSSLKEDIMLSNKYELVESMRDRLKRHKEGSNLRELLSSSLQKWIQETTVSIRRGSSLSSLVWEEIAVSGGRVLALLPESRQKRYLDLSLENPRFSLLEAKLVGNNLELRLSLDFANDQSLEDITLPLIVHNVKPN